MSVNINSIVFHNHYGKGDVLKIEEDTIYVSFEEKQRIFPFPEALDKGYLVPYLAEDQPAKPVSDTADLAPEDIRHRIMIIKINKLYKENMAQEDLYNAVRGIWKASIKRAQTMDYVFGVYHSMIVAVYKPTVWYVCKEALDRLPREDIVISSRNENRIFFRDESFEKGLPLDNNQKFYFGKSIEKLPMNKSAQNPITYLELWSDV